MNTRSELTAIITQLESLEATTPNSEVAESLNQALYYLNHAYEAANRG